MSHTIEHIQQARQAVMRSIDRFTTRHPIIGPILWILALQYFVVQLIVAAAWPRAYSWSGNVISDLGALGCGDFGDRYVCSPLSWLMNLSFVVFGVTIAVGGILIYTEFKRTKVSKIGFGLMVISGIGTIVVGFFPEDANVLLHQIGAVAGLLVGNMSLIFLASSLKDTRNLFRAYTLLTGLFCVTAFGLFATDNYLDFGVGGMERLVSYPFAIWMMVFGIYMTYVRLRM